MAARVDVIVLGAGAAGLMCALTAGQRGRSVLLLEKANKTGKKILMSGGGRCNFTNRMVTPENFISGNPHFCKSALKRFTQWDFIAMVERHGIAYEERKHGQLFCLNSARDILDMLERECDAAGVRIRTRSEVGAVSPVPAPGAGQPDGDATSAPRFRVEFTESGQAQAASCSSLVVATGALSIPTLGGSGLGYELATRFGLALVPRRAGLVPFMFSDATLRLCSSLAGVAVPAAVSCNGQQFTENILFTHRGISGPAMLQISNYWQPGDSLEVDLLPAVGAGDWLLAAKRDHGRNRLQTQLAQSLPRALVLQLQTLRWPKRAGAALAELSDRELLAIGKSLNHWQLKPSATEGYRTAEVTLGGVDTGSLSSKTMEATGHPGLFFIGEVVDVTGHLGGFNFQWAWSSGYCAGGFA